MARKKKSEAETNEELAEFIEEARSKKSRSAEPKRAEIDPGRARALDAVLGNITKRFGEGSIMRLGEATHLHVETIPTGSHTDQSIASTTTAYPMQLNTTDYALGVSVTNGSRMKVDYSGLYNIQFSAQFSNTDSQIQDISIWFRKNGTNVVGSNGEFSINERHGTIDGSLIAAFNLFIPLAKDDYAEIMWRATSTSVVLLHIPTQTSPARPATPSVIATVHHISSNGYTTNTFTEPFLLSRTQGSAVMESSPLRKAAA